MKITNVGFVGVGQIDLELDSSDEMRIVSLGIVKYGPINLGFDLRDEKNISVGVVKKMTRAPNTAWLQELEEINQSIQEKNVELRRLLQNEEDEKQRL